MRGIKLTGLSRGPVAIVDVKGRIPSMVYFASHPSHPRHPPYHYGVLYPYNNTVNLPLPELGPPPVTGTNYWPQDRSMPKFHGVLQLTTIAS